MLLCIPLRDAVKRHLALVLAMGTLALYPAGYLLVYSEERYLWPVLFLLIALTGQLLTLAFATPFLADPRRRVLLAAVLARVVREDAAPSTARVARVRPQHEPLRRGLRGTDLRDKRIASDEDYGASTIVAYYAGAKYLGQNPPVKWTPADLYAALGRRASTTTSCGQDGAGRGPSHRFERVKDVTVPAGNGGQTKLTILRLL